MKKPYKITKEIEKFVLSEVKHNVNITLWELSKLINKRYKVLLNDKSIFNILSRVPDKKIGS